MSENQPIDIIQTNAVTSIVSAVIRYALIKLKKHLP